MYEIRPESIKTFITDRNVRLPRFQRKQTWDPKKNFQLCISLFKEYPIGVCILSVDEGRGKTIRWLLDGRQRKNALQSMYEDPENIYDWGKKFIGFKNSDQPSEIEEKFYQKINEYIEADLDEDFDNFDGNQVDTTTAVEEDDDGGIIRQETYGLDLLFDIIRIIHNRSVKASGFTKPFDFSKYINKLPYIENKGDGKEQLSSRKVKVFIDRYQDYCLEERRDPEDMISFVEFIKADRCDIVDEAKAKVLIASKWEAIKERMLIVEKIDNLLSNSKIGMIEVKNLSPSDSQKIFNIINSEGEKLTSVEILSAKPHWNIVVDNPSQATINAVRLLYERIGAQQEGVVRWDLPATFVKRLGDNFILKKLSDSNTDFEKELTIGFKLLAGIYVGGVKKESIEKLGRYSGMNWTTDYDQLVNDIGQMLKLIGGFKYFKYFKSWRTSIMEISSDAIAINFLILAYKDWERKGKPIGDSTAKKFQKNCFILWDKLIFEYLNKQWRGAADQKTANNIEELSHEPEMFECVTESKWHMLLKQIFEESAIESIDVSVALMKPVLYHMYCMRCISGPGTEYSIEVDHIIPQTLFNESIIQRKSAVQHNILNLGLLPKNENVAKSNKKLRFVEDEWLRQEITRYEFIQVEDFEKYSDINNYEEMFKQRAAFFYEAFSKYRNDMLNN